jgi:hypothetical protein
MIILHPKPPPSPPPPSLQPSPYPLHTTRHPDPYKFLSKPPCLLPFLPHSLILPHQLHELLCSFPHP